LHTMDIACRAMQDPNYGDSTAPDVADYIPN